MTISNGVWVCWIMWNVMVWFLLHCWRIINKYRRTFNPARFTELSLAGLARLMKQRSQRSAPTCSSQSDSRYDESLTKQLSKPQSSLSFRHSQPVLLTKGMRSIWTHTRPKYSDFHQVTKHILYTAHVVYKTLWVSHVCFAILYQFLKFLKLRSCTQHMFCVCEVRQVLVTHISLWNVWVLVSWVVLCLLFNLLLQTCSVTPLILINSNPVPEEQERGCCWDVVGCCCSLWKK